MTPTTDLPTNSEMPRLRVLVAAHMNTPLINAPAAACSATVTGYGPCYDISEYASANQELTFIGALLQLFVIGSLLNDVQNGVCELRVRQRVRLRKHRRSCVASQTLPEVEQ